MSGFVSGFPLSSVFAGRFESLHRYFWKPREMQRFPRLFYFGYGKPALLTTTARSQSTNPAPKRPRGPTTVLSVVKTELVLDKHLLQQAGS